mgnify:CR=1 FL=1
MRRTALWILAIALVCAAGGPAQALPARQSQQAEAKAAAPLINLNTATVEQLEKLPGVGPKTAERIIEYRQKNGAFKKVEELMNVKGIGEKSFLKIKSQLTVGTPKPSCP